MACDANRTPMVAETDEESADFGRTALIEAIVKLSEAPTSPEAFQSFALRVDELMPLFNRDVKREAELRVCVLAIGPLQHQLDEPQSDQMQAFALTVWPSVLQIATRESESVSDYIRRLCDNELEIECNNIVPEYWPHIINARVWRTLKSRINVAYARCHWCEQDPDFAGVLETSRKSHQKVELMAKDAQSVGRPSRWPVAGKHASAKSSVRSLAFRKHGWVTVQKEEPQGGDWRSALSSSYKEGDALGVQIAPGQTVETLLGVLADVGRAGYQKVLLAARKRSFPYESMEYELRPGADGFASLGVRKQDTIQVLVQALDYQASKSSAKSRP